MTLDEAIIHAEEVAMLNENTCKAKPNLDLKMYRKCAEEHRQLAKWLKDYKRLLERETVLDKIRAEIKALPNANPSYWHSGDMVERDDVFDIIDKYKAESEE